jgi:hypothetical protein
MTTINNLPLLPTLRTSDQFVVWAPNQGDSRRVPYNAIKADILDSFNSDIAATVMTFSNKTFNLVDNVLTGTFGQFNAACSDADFASTATAQTLTNKTMALGSNNLTTIATGTGAVSRTVQAKLADMLDRRDFATLQQAVNAVAASGGALYLGDADFTVTSTITLPDGDYAIIGPGSAALAITFTGTGGLFVGTGLASTSNIDIGGFRAIAGAANCGHAIDIAYTTSAGIDVRSVHVFDVVAEFAGSATNYWTGGMRFNNARNTIVQASYVHGPTFDLTRTIEGYAVTGEATDVKLSDCQAVSVGTAVSITGTAEGTLLTNFVAVDVNVGVSKVHSGGSEPWLSMSSWHINCRQKGFYFDNVLQTTITTGLLYCQNGTGNWIGVHVANPSVAAQDLQIDALIDGQLAGGGVSSLTGMKIDGGNGINARLKLRSLDTGVEIAAGVTNTLVDVDANSVTNIVTGAGAYAATNRVSANLPGNGYGHNRTSGPYNPDNSTTANKRTEAYGFGEDTTGAVKPTGGVAIVSQDNNWVNAETHVMTRRGDALARGMTLFGTGTPEGAVAAPTGALYTRQDGGTGTTLYVKESGTGNTGWVAK